MIWSWTKEYCSEQLPIESWFEDSYAGVFSLKHPNEDCIFFPALDDGLNSFAYCRHFHIWKMMYLYLFPRQQQEPHYHNDNDNNKDNNNNNNNRPGLNMMYPYLFPASDEINRLI